jgi:hypothetical protein
VKLYAEKSLARSRHIIADLGIIAWVVFWIWASRWLYELILRLSGPGQKAEAAGTGLAQNFAEAGDKAGGVPVVGDSLSAPFDKAADAANGLAQAGRDLQSAVHDVAVAASLLILIVPMALVLFGWLPWRVRWVRRASAAAALRSDPVGRDMLALRALARRPLRRLVALGPDAASAWRAEDESTLEALAEMELASMGLSSKSFRPRR